MRLNFLVCSYKKELEEAVFIKYNKRERI